MQSKVSKKLKKIRSNLTIIFEIVLPFLFFEFLVYGKNIKGISKIDHTSFLIFAISWIFLSYLKGRYSTLNKLNLSNFILAIKELIISSSILTIIFLFLKVIGLNDIFDSRVIPRLLAIFNLFAIFKDFLMLKIYDTYDKNKFIEILFIGEKLEFDIFNKILKEYNFKKRIKFKDLGSSFKSNEIPDQVIISKTSFIDISENKSFRNLLSRGAKIFPIAKWFEFELNCLPVEFIEKENFVNTKIFSNNKDIEFRLKRSGDIIVGVLILIASFPIFLISCFLIWINDKGPVFYSQKREGLFKEEIKIIKLRTMKIDAEKNGPEWSKNNDKRITYIGKILRRSRIDELPQIISVIKGEMSLIGPRPERPEFNKKLNKLIPNYYLRNYIKPGLSGWAQVNYPYGASLGDAKKKLSYDIYYIRNFSFWIDLLILFKTARIVFNGIGSKPK